MDIFQSHGIRVATLFHPMHVEIHNIVCLPLSGILAAYEWGWLSIFVACILISVAISAIILTTVWATGGFSGRN